MFCGPASDARPAAPIIGVIGATRVNRTRFAFGPGALAEFLAVLFQKQIGPLPRFDILGDLARDFALSNLIVRTIVLLLQAAANPDQHMRTIGRNSGDRRDAAEQQYAVNSGIGDTRELLEHFPNLRQRPE